MINGKSAKLPDFLLVGAPRSGTTTLYQYFKMHPGIFVGKKEPHFFSLEGKEPSFTQTKYIKENVWELSFYIQLFEAAGDHQKIGDCSPSYLPAYKQSIRHIKKIYGHDSESIKIIMILRNPVDAVYSHYLHQIKRRKENLSLGDAIKPEIIRKRTGQHPQYNYIALRMYYRQVKAYLENFPHVSVFYFEDLKNPTSLLKNIFSFLEVRDITDGMTLKIRANPSGIPKNMVFFRILNSYLLPKTFRNLVPPGFKTKLSELRQYLIRNTLIKPQMDPDIRRTLLSLFRDDIADLGKLLNKDLSHWLTAHSNEKRKEVKAN
jgi:hypothetical protein